MNEQPNTPDMIAQAGELLRRLQHGGVIATTDYADSDDRAIVVASAILAVAGEIRELRNVLALAMSEGSNMNGEPISFLRIETGA